MTRLNARWYNFKRRGQAWTHFWQDSSGNDVTLALTGQSLSVSQGDLTPGWNRRINLFALPFETISQGDVTPILFTDVALTGQSASVSAGSLSVTLAGLLLGESVTGTQGAFTPTWSRRINLTAVPVETISQGDVTPVLFTEVALTGQSQTASAGTLSVTWARGLTGQAETEDQGALSVSVGGSIQLTGQGQAIGLGTLAATLAKALTGSAVADSAGAIKAALSSSLAAAGQSQVLSQADLSPVFSCSLTGSFQTDAAGTIIAGTFTLGPMPDYKPVMHISSSRLSISTGQGNGVKPGTTTRKIITH